MKKKRLILLMLILSLIMSTIPASASEETKQLKDLATGSIVYDPSWTWKHKTGNAYTGNGEIKPVEWIVVAQDHYKNSTTGIVNGNHTTLISNELIAKYAFDDRYNTDYGENYGYNHWGDSNKIRPFLNTSFFNNFSSNFKNLVLETTLNMQTYNGSSYTTKDKVFLPSEKELGGNNTPIIGTDWGYFNSNSSRIAKSGSVNRYYWTRSPGSGSSYSVRYVYSDGSFGTNHYAYNSSYGVRPALNLKSDTLVKSVGSKWEIVYNSPPALNISNPNNAQTIGSSGKIAISGTIFDSDNDTVTISATIGGKLKSATVNSTSTSKPWTLEWLGSELNDGTYSNTIITAKDDKGNTTTKTYTGTILVDKTNPTNPTISVNEDWTSTNVEATITSGTDSGSGVDKTEYSLSGATTLSWTTISSGGKVTISNEGQTTIKARTVDKAGNTSTEVSKIIKIDKTKPTKPTLIADTTNPTNKDVTITVTPGTDSGSGVDRSEYKIGSGSWATYSQPFKVTSNNTVEARTIDKVGNVSDLGSIVVSNINKDAPIITIEPYNEDWTNKDIIVTATVDKGTLNKTSHTFTENGSFTFIATDEYGNEGAETVTITNIDKIKPKIKITIIRN